MAVKIRLARHGRSKRPFYHIVIADARAPRDGRFIEKIGTYNPMTSPATIDVDRDKAFDWLMKGAQPTDTVRAILRFKGVLYRKHLMRGVRKGALTEEQAMAQYQAWIDAKEARIAERFAESEQKKADFRKQLSGIKPVVIREEPVVEEVATEDAENAEGTAEAVVEAAADAAVEATAEAAEEISAQENTEEKSADEKPAE